MAQPPKATFVTRLQPCRSPGRAARQLPDQSTTLWVDSSSTGDSRRRGALPLTDINPIATTRRSEHAVHDASRFGHDSVEALRIASVQRFCEHRSGIRRKDG